MAVAVAAGGGSQPPTYDVRSFTVDRHVDVYSTGAEWEARPLKGLGTVLGAAVNHQDRPDGASDTAPTWLAGLTYDATGALRLHASASRKIRVPSIDQLFNTSSGNPDLQSEHAYGVDVAPTTGWTPCPRSVSPGLRRMRTTSSSVSPACRSRTRTSTASAVPS